MSPYNNILQGRVDDITSFELGQSDLDYYTKILGFYPFLVFFKSSFRTLY